MGGRGYLARALMCNTSLFFLVFFRSSPSFFLSFFFYISSFFFMPFFLSAFLFFFLSFFLALLFFFFLSFLSWYTERAPTRTRVCWDSTRTAELLKKAFRCAFFETLFFARSLCGYQSRRPVRRCWLFVRSPVLCVFPLCFCVRNASTVAPFPLVCLSCVRCCPACLFFAFFCPLTPFFCPARLFYRPPYFSPLYRVIF